METSQGYKKNLNYKFFSLLNLPFNIKMKVEECKKKIKTVREKNSTSTKVHMNLSFSSRYEFSMYAAIGEVERMLGGGEELQP